MHYKRRATRVSAHVISLCRFYIRSIADGDNVSLRKTIKKKRVIRKQSRERGIFATRTPRGRKLSAHFAAAEPAELSQARVDGSRCDPSSAQTRGRLTREPTRA